MKKILIILFTIISFVAKSQLPTGLPQWDTRKWVEFKNYLQNDSGFFNALRDTNWIPRQMGAQIFWRNGATDTTLWVYDGLRWKKLGEGGGGSQTWEGTLTLQSTTPFASSHTVNFASNDLTFDSLNILTLNTTSFISPFTESASINNVLIQHGDTLYKTSLQHLADSLAFYINGDTILPVNWEMTLNNQGTTPFTASHYIDANTHTFNFTGGDTIEWSGSKTYMEGISKITIQSSDSATFTSNNYLVSKSSLAYYQGSTKGIFGYATNSGDSTGFEAKVGSIRVLGLPSSTQSNIIYYNSTSNTISYGTAPSGSVTSVAATAASGMTVTGSPITTSGTLAFAWTGAVQGDLPYFSGTNTISFLNKSATAGFVLTNGGTSNNPTWAAPFTLTTTGTSGAATYSAGVLNVPQYAGGVTSVSNSDGTLTISPTTGAVVASLNLAHANTWSAKQTFATGTTSLAPVNIPAGTLTTGGNIANGNVEFNGTHMYMTIGGVQTQLDNQALLLTIGTFNNTSTANALDISGTVITAHAADGTNPGSVSTTTQTLGAGTKTFSDMVAYDIGTSSATTLTLDNSSPVRIFTGSSATVWTLPALSGNTGWEYTIFNKGTAAIALTRAGSDQVYTTSAVTSVQINPGESYNVVNDGTNWKADPYSQWRDTLISSNVYRIPRGANTQRIGIGNVCCFTSTAILSVIGDQSNFGNMAVLGQAAVAPSAPTLSVTPNVTSGNGPTFTSVGSSTYTGANTVQAITGASSIATTGPTGTFIGIQGSMNTLSAANYTTSPIDMVGIRGSISFTTGATSIDLTTATAVSAQVFLNSNPPKNLTSAYGVRSQLQAITTDNPTGKIGTWYGLGIDSVSNNWFSTAAYGVYQNGTNSINIFDGKAKFGDATSAAPTAKIHIAAGTATANTAPLKFTSGTNLTTPEDGALEYNGTDLQLDVSTTRYILNKSLSGSGTLDFGNTSAQSSADLTITVTGAASGDVVLLGVPNGSTLTNSDFTAWVSAANTVTVRFNNYSSGAQDPASGSFNVRVVK